MAGVFAFVRRLAGIEAIDIFKVRHGSIQPLAVDEKMPVVADLHAFAGLHHHPLDVKLILRHEVVPHRIQIQDAFGLEHDDFAARRLAEIVSYSIHEQVVARSDAKVRNVVTFMIDVPPLQMRPIYERIRTCIRWLTIIWRKSHDMFESARLW